MTTELMLRRKLTLRAHGKRVVFVKKSNERTAHVLLKSFLWALYLPAYPNLLVEVPVGDRYKPDVVALDAFGNPTFWGEAGQVSPDKIHSLVRRYRHTHLALAKWDTPLAPFKDIVASAVSEIQRTAPFDLLNFPPDSAERFVDERGTVTVRRSEIEWVRFGRDKGG